MTIILMRHGRPSLRPMGRIAARDMASWIQEYHRCEIENEDPPALSVELARQAVHVVTSVAPRAVVSTMALGLTPTVAEAQFGEAELPFADWRWPKLDPKLWAALFRLLWLFGYSREAEPFPVARARSQSAAERLIGLAEDGPVLLLGHGVMNRLIAKALEAKGWSSPDKGGHGFWDARVFKLAADRS